MESIPRQLLGKYRLVKEIGAGGMARVYLATLLTFDKPVAIKILHRRLSEDEDYITRFHNEARAAIKLPLHPHVAFVHDSGRVQNFHFIVMEFVEGISLKQSLQDGSIASVERVLEVIEQILEALKFIHDYGIVHRDVKPSNVMITTGGSVKLTDFGVAREVQSTRKDITRAGEIIGTPEYMSPEQASGGKVDDRSDVFSVGTILYEMLSGHSPFAAPTSLASLYKVIKTPPDPLPSLVPEIPEPLARFAHRALQKETRHRYASARDMLEELTLVRSSLPREISKLKPRPVSIDSDGETVLTNAESVTATTAAIFPQTAAATGSTSKWIYKLLLVIMVYSVLSLVYWGHNRLTGEESFITLAIPVPETYAPSHPIPGLEDAGGPDGRIPKPVPLPGSSSEVSVKPSLAEPATRLSESVLHDLLQEVKTLSLTGDFMAAIAFLEREISARGPDRRLITSLGWQYLHLGLYNEALGEAGIVLAEDDGDADAHLLRGASLLSKYSYEEKIGIGGSQSEYYEAESEINHALVISPVLIDGYYYLGEIYLYRGWYDRAKNEFLEVLSRDNSHVRAHHKLGITYLKLGQPHMAKGRTERAIALQPGFLEARIDYVRVLLALDDERSAEREARSLLSLYPDEAEVRMVISESLCDGGSYNEALEQLDKGQELGASGLEVAKARSKVYFLKAFNQPSGTIGEKVHWYRKSLEAYPENKRARENLAAVYTQLGVESSALVEKEKWYRKALEVDPDCLEARLNMRGLRQRTNKLKLVHEPISTDQKTKKPPGPLSEKIRQE
ncbi:MAG: protein kinase, partial [bacterium]|nr:protein kinase [bacterium]